MDSPNREFTSTVGLSQAKREFETTGAFSPDKTVTQYSVEAGAVAPSNALLSPRITGKKRTQQLILIGGGNSARPTALRGPRLVKCEGENRAASIENDDAAREGRVR